MGLFARSSRSVVLVLVLAPAMAAAQVPPASPAPARPPGGGAPAATTAPGTAAPGTAPAADAAEKKPAGEMGGYSFSDKPAKRAASRGVVRHVSGPIATLPGFEQTGDGGSRFFVQLTQQVPVEERRAQGSITYVLKGAHVNKWNNTNALVTVHFNTPVWRARLVAQGNDLLFVLDLRDGATPTYKVQEAPDKTSTLTVDFPKGDHVTPGAEPPTPAEPAGTEEAPPKKKGGKGKKKAGAAPAPAQPAQPAQPAPAGDTTGPTP